MSVFTKIVGADRFDWRVIPINWDAIEGDEIKAGMPMDKDGNVANNARIYGITMDRLIRGRNKEGRVIISGAFDFEEAEANCGVHISDAARSALKNVWCTSGGSGGGSGGGTSIPTVSVAIYEEWDEETYETTYKICSTSHSANEVVGMAKNKQPILFEIQNLNNNTELDNYSQAEVIMGYKYLPPAPMGFYTEQVRVDMNAIYGRLIFDTDGNEIRVETGME